MKLQIKSLFLLNILGLIGFSLIAQQPSFASFDGKISKNHFYDTKKTIMPEIKLNKEVKTEKYWDNNIFYINKYKPIFMLSNKDLYDLIPKENVSIYQRINTPAVYNISLKTTSIKNISLVQPKIQKTEAKKMVSAQNQKIKTSNSEIFNKQKVSYYDLVYQQAKNPDTDADEKINAAISLKNSKISSNYTLAINLLDEVTKKETFNAYAFYLKGETYALKKDNANAIKNYVEAIKINPTSKQCYIGIAKVLEKTNKELSQKYYDKAMLLSKF